jgi:RNA polymerase sigma factor (sigma-70 family)
MDSNTKQTYTTRMTLLQKMQRQDDDMAWDEFVSIYSDYIYVIIRKMNISYADVGDIQQQVFLKLWKQLPKLDLGNMTRFRGYVATTAKNCTYDFFRHEARRGGNKKVEFEERLHALEEVPQSEVDRIAEQEWKNYVYALAFKNIAGKFSPEAIAIFKGTMEGKDLRELAEKIGIPPSSAYRLRNRIKESLLAEIKALNDYLG